MSTLRSCSSQKQFGCIRGGLDGSAVLIVTYPRLFGRSSCGSTEILLCCWIFLVRLNQAVNVHFWKKARLKGWEVYKWTGILRVNISCYLVGIFGRKRYRMIFRIPCSTPTSLGIVCWGSRNNKSRPPDLILVWKLYPTFKSCNTGMQSDSRVPL